MDINKFKQATLKALFLMTMQMLFTILFGKINLIIGILFSIAAVVFLGRDFTSQIKYRTITFLIINIYLTIASYFVATNLYLGLILNIITIFSVTYVYMNDYRNPTSYIFLMNYIFMITKKIEFSELPLRLLAVCSGVMIIIIMQLLFNKNKFETKSNKAIEVIIQELINVIDDLIEGKYNEKQSIKINKKIRKLILFINEKAHKKSHKNMFELNQFNITICLARLNVIITHVARYEGNKDNKNNYLRNLKNQIVNIGQFNEGLKSEEEINEQIEILCKRYEKISKDISFVEESLDVLKIFSKCISIKDEDSQNILSQIYKNIDMPKPFDILESMRENFNIHSLRFTYSIRLSLAISFAIFIAAILNVKNQSWIILSAYVVLQPYKEQAIIRARQRFIGGIIGAILFFVTFTTIKDLLPLTLVMFIAFIGYFYFTDYDKQVIMTTFVSLGTISLVDNLDNISIERVLLVSIGILIGLLFNEYILPYNMKDSIEELKEKYKRNKRDIIKESNLIVKGKQSLNELMYLSMERSKIENKLILNSSKINNYDIDKFIYEQNMEVSDDKYLLLKYFYKEVIS